MRTSKHNQKKKRKLLRMALLKGIKLILDIIKEALDIFHNFRS